MKKRDMISQARSLGYDQGFGLVKYGEFDGRPSLDEVRSAAWDAELEVARQYAGHPVYEINSMAGERPDDEWLTEELHDAMEAGINRGINAGYRARFGKPSVKKRATPRKNPSVACAPSRKKDRYRKAKVKHKGEWIGLNGCWNAKGVPSYAGYGETGRLRVIAKRVVSSKASRSPRLVKGARARKRS